MSDPLTSEELLAQGKVIKLFCIICGTPFYIWKSKRKGTFAQGMRWANSVTCNNSCSEARKKLSSSLSRKDQENTNVST